MKKKNVILSIALLSSLAITACGNNNNQMNNSNMDMSKPNNAPQAGQDNTQAESFYYTANEGGSISKIDATTNKVINTIKEDGIVHNVQVSPDGKILGATFMPKMANMGNMNNMDQSNNHSMEMPGYALFLDTKSNQLIQKVQVGNHPSHIVFTQDGKYVLVTNNEDNKVSIIDAKTYKVVQTVPTGKGPHGFRISSESKYAYIANMGEDTVSVIDLSTLKETKRIKVGKTPVTTGITKDGRTLVVAINAENALAIVDLDSGKVDKVLVGVGPAQVYIEPDDKYAFAANQGTEKNPSHSVSKIDLAMKKVVATIETGRGAHGVVTSPNNKMVYVANMFDNTVTVIDNQNNKVIATVPVGTTPNGITFKQ